MSSTNRGAKRAANDLYPTPAAPISALLSALDIPLDITFLEPCRGNGAIYDLMPFGNRPAATPPSTTERRNAANRQEGAAFENRLNLYHQSLDAQGLAKPYKTNPDIKMTGANRAVVIGKGPVDYIVPLATGALVCFDAKSRTGTAFSYSGKDVAHQLAWLRTMAHWGHPAGLLVYWKDYDQVRWHPIASFDKRVRLADGALVAGVAWLPVVTGRKERI